MAAMVLGVAGSVIGGMFGGPLGAALGQLAGSALGNLIDPQKVEGPRLSDLKLQSAQYGEFITIFWGTMRFAGKVIWQTDLVEHEQTTSGKGGPEVTEFTYTCSFAILLADRTGMTPIIGVPKIWADSRLVHDTASYTSQSALPFTLYTGTETQMPDPTIELDKGVGFVPAHRGLAYLVFTDLPMGDFGNRIPNFTFLVTDQAPIDVALHLTLQNDYPLPVQWYENFGSTGIGHPYITSWDTRTGGKIVVKNLGSTPSHEYNSIDLSYSGTVAYLGAGSTGLTPVVVARIDNPSVDFMTFYYVGHVYYGDSLNAVYAEVDRVVQNGTQNAALFSGNVWNEDDVNYNTSVELAESAGITTGEFMKGAVVQQDMLAFFVFTSPAPGAGSPADKWYQIRNGVVVANGTIDQTGIGLAVDLYGSAAGSYASSYNCAMFENNGRWMWWFTGAGSSNVFRTYHIDDAGVLAYNVAGGAAGGTNISNGTFTSTSIWVLAEGFCGAVTMDQLAICSRFPVYSPEGIPLSDLVADISGRCGLDQMEVNVTSIADDLVPGYLLAVQGSGRAAIAPLQSGYMFDAVESDLTMKFVKRGSDSVITIPDDDLAAARYGDELPDALHVTRVPEDELPQQVNVDFLNLDEAYQQGHAYDRREVTNSELQQIVGLPIAMTPIRARQVAQQLLYNQWIERERFEISLPRKYAYLEPTDVITVMGRRLRLTKEDQSQDGVIRFEGVAAATRTWLAGPAGVAGSGFTPGVPPIKQQTDLILLDIPLYDSSDAQPGFAAAFAGQTSPSWRGASLYVSDDAGVSYNKIDSQTVADTFGYTVTALPDYVGGNTFDEISTVDVALTLGAGPLASMTEAQVLNGANECVIGTELVQFKTATLTGTRQYRLSGLLRGRYGTEWSMPGHIALERFVVLPAKDYAMSVAELGLNRIYKAVTVGNTLASADEVPFINSGVRVRPLSPVFLSGGTDGASTVTIHWTRRSRIPAAWAAPLGETDERYVLQIWNSTFTLVARQVTGLLVPTFVYTAAMQTTDFGSTQDNIYVSVGQVGTYLYGYEARATIPSDGASDTAPLAPVPAYVNPSAPPPPATTTDQNHLANFAGLFNAGGRDRQLAYRYTRIGGANGGVIGWYQRVHQTQIIPIFFGGDAWAWSLWVQDADLSAPNSPAEDAMLGALATAAGA